MHAAASERPREGLSGMVPVTVTGKGAVITLQNTENIVNPETGPLREIVKESACSRFSTTQRELESIYLDGLDMDGARCFL